jgi:hypothetical protein
MLLEYFTESDAPAQATSAPAAADTPKEKSGDSPRIGEADELPPPTRSTASEPPKLMPHLVPIARPSIDRPSIIRLSITQSPVVQVPVTEIEEAQSSPLVEATVSAPPPVVESPPQKTLEAPPPAAELPTKKALHSPPSVQRSTRRTARHATSSSPPLPPQFRPSCHPSRPRPIRSWRTPPPARHRQCSAESAPLQSQPFSRHARRQNTSRARVPLTRTCGRLTPSL